jgi:hypothetical protein
VRAGDPKTIRDAIKRLDAAKLRARNMGAPDEEVRRAASTTPQDDQALRFIDRRDGTFIAMRGEREVARASVEGKDLVKGVKIAAARTGARPRPSCAATSSAHSVTRCARSRKPHRRRARHPSPRTRTSPPARAR